MLAIQAQNKNIARITILSHSCRNVDVLEGSADDARLGEEICGPHRGGHDDQPLPYHTSKSDHHFSISYLCDTIHEPGSSLTPLSQKQHNMLKK